MALITRGFKPFSAVGCVGRDEETSRITQKRSFGVKISIRTAATDPAPNFLVMDTAAGSWVYDLGEMRDFVLTGGISWANRNAQKKAPDPFFLPGRADRG